MADKFVGTDLAELAQKSREALIEKNQPPKPVERTATTTTTEAKPVEAVSATTTTEVKPIEVAPTELKKETATTPRTLAEQLRDAKESGELDNVLTELGIKVATPELTEEQKKEQVENRKKSFFNFATNSKLATTDELVKFETLKDVAPENLLFEDFANELKSQNKEDIKANPKTKELSDEDIKEEFNEYYHQTEDAPERLKNLGSKKLKADAENLKNSKLTKYNQINQIFDNEEKLEGNKKEYAGAITNYIKEVKPTIPVSVTYTGADGKEQKVELTIPIADTDENAKKIAEGYFTLDPVADRFIQTKSYNKKEQLQFDFTNYAFIKNKEAILNAIYQSGISKGIEVGAVGVRAPIEKHTPSDEQVNNKENNAFGTEALKRTFKQN